MRSLPLSPLRAASHAALLFAIVGCGAAPHADHDAGSDDREDAGHHDAGMFVPRDGGADDDAGPPAVWRVETCAEALGRGRTGQACAGDFYCGGLEAFASCDVSEHMVIHRYAIPLCESAAPVPASSCELALAGMAGQRCEGSLACAETDPSDPCCVEIALCNPEVFPGGSYPADALYRARICDTECALTPRAERAPWTECPPVWGPGDVDPLSGDPCEGTWSCMAGPDRFGSYPSSIENEVVPVWCDGSVLHVGASVAPLLFPPARCE